MSVNRIYTCDCTLRDARHSPGVSLSTNDCAGIAKLLGELGVDEIEAGLANGDPNEASILRACAENKGDATLSSLFFCLKTATIEDSVAFAVDNGCDAICISIPTSEDLIELKLKRSMRATISLMQKAVSYAVAKGLKVAFSGEDAARASNDFLINYINAGADVGANRFRFAETVGCLNPRLITEKIKILATNVTLPIEVHCHATLGMAEANSIAAIDAGAQAVSGTINGIGERGGNASIGTLLLYLYQFHNQTNFQLDRLTPLCQLTARVFGLALHRFVPIVGQDAFQYEIGGQYRSEDVYEPLSAAIVGNQRKLVFGLKKDAITMDIFLAQANIQLSKDQRQFLHAQLSALVDEKKEALNQEDWLKFSQKLLDIRQGENIGINNS